MIGPANQVLHRCHNIDALLQGLGKSVCDDDNRELLLARIREIRFKTRQLPRAMRFLPRAMQLLRTGTDLDRAYVNVVSLVHEAASDFDWDRDVKYVMTVNPVLAVNVNRAWIVEAFFNIVDNGIRAIRDKGAAGLLTISATTNSDNIQITFKDTGIGMSSEEINMMLRGSIPLSLHRTGTGVPLIRMLLAAHGGDLFMESQKGSGTSVTVMLPWDPKSFESSHAER
jgi:signal transduction histidine kinase